MKQRLPRWIYPTFGWLWLFLAIVKLAGGAFETATICALLALAHYHADYLAYPKE